MSEIPSEMRIVMFKTPTPKRFKYKPRYYDEEKDKLEQRKAELGLDSQLTKQESLRLRMRRRWKPDDVDTGKNRLSKVIYYGFYAFVIIGGVYAIFFTDLVDKIISLFGIGR